MRIWACTSKRDEGLTTDERYPGGVKRSEAQNKLIETFAF